MNAPGTRRYHCPDHGEADACLVCTHLKKGRGLGYHESAAGSALREAWCNRCDFWRRSPAPLATAYQFLAGGRVMVCEHCLVLARIGNERPKA